MRIDIDVAKTPKHGADISGDTVDVVERRDGGLSMIVADGKGSYAEAKFVSSFVVTKAMSLIAEGTRDGAAARAAHDALYSIRNGKASAGFLIVSADLADNSLVITRNSECPVFVRKGEELLVFQEAATLLGSEKMVKPNIYVVDLAPDTIVVTFTDGFLGAGAKDSAGWNVRDAVMQLSDDVCKSENIALALLRKAMERDKGKPADDMSVAVMSVSPVVEAENIRRMTVSMPA